MAEEKKSGDIDVVKTEIQKFEPGVARIKEQFIDHNHKSRLAVEYLPQTAIDSFQNYDKKDGSEHEDGPPKKKVKLRGRNKQRPRDHRKPPSDILCPNIARQKDCRFGEKCKFIHDVGKYLEEKPTDLGERCYTFDTYGKCYFGLTCRFGKSHIKDHKSVINEELFDKTKDIVRVRNLLSKEVQQKLWKRQYNFAKANEIFTKVVKDFKIKQEVQEKESSVKTTDTKEGANKEKQLDCDKNGAQAAKPLNAENDCGSEKTKRTETVKVLDSPKDENILQQETKKETIPKVNEKNNVAEDLESVKISGGITDEEVIKLRPQEKPRINFSDKLYLAPLTTVGNLPFRRICKGYGVDITCSEMAMATNLLKGQQSEWALLKRHACEDLFGVQICGSFPDSMTRVSQLLSEQIEMDFLDINVGCPIDLVYKRGEGCALMGRHGKFEQVIKSMKEVLAVPLTVKMRTGIFDDKYIAHTLVPKLKDWDVDLVTLHGRTREQRYTKLADWDYINQCAELAKPMPLFGNGDVLSFEDANLRREATGVSGLMMARGALIKPWIFTEIKEQRHWDISSSERFDMLKNFANYGLEHWGSDTQGIATTRRFLLEWLSFLCRYIPVGLLEQVPQKINQKPPFYFGRNDLETMMASENCADWIKLTEMLLGPVPDGYTFLPKHKANAYK